MWMSQPGRLCGNTAASGIDTGVKPYSDSTRAIAGMPVATARNVLPLHGSVVAVSTFAPAEPVQPVPYGSVVAGQVDSRRATRAETKGQAKLNPPPATRPPLCIVRALTVWSTPKPIGDQLEPFQRAIRSAPTPPAVVNSPPATTSPFGNAASARTVQFTPLPTADQLEP